MELEPEFVVAGLDARRHGVATVATDRLPRAIDVVVQLHAQRPQQLHIPYGLIKKLIIFKVRM